MTEKDRMDHNDQTAIKAFLADPSTHRLTGPVDRINTHISNLFLIGARAFKLKRAVQLPYLDFSTPQKRLAACQTELRLNRRTAPELYLRVRQITAGPDGPEFDGAGPLLDAVVEMRRFDQDAIFNHMAQRGALTSRHLDALSHEITAFHAAAEVDADADGAHNIDAVLKINAAGFQQSDVFTQAQISCLNTVCANTLNTHAARLNARARAGQVRRCHGDLHLRNICVFEGRVRLFDCLEFNDALATVDVLYDLAFLAMDLWHQRLCAQASHVVNRYVDTGAQEDGFVLMPFFMALRAAVRAHVTATQAMSATDNQAALIAEARAYFELAECILKPKKARLVAIGGLSASGKSTLAAALAPHLGRAPGARAISSDRTRKAMFDTPPDQALPSEAYSPDVSKRVYVQMAGRAQCLLADGVTVIVDAVHDRPQDRARIAAAAKTAKVPFNGLWLQTNSDQLHRRLKTRDPGASDATADVLEKQLAHAPKVTGWTPITTSGPLHDSLALALQALNQSAADAPQISPK